MAEEKSEETTVSEGSNMLASSGIGQLMNILDGHLKLMQEKDKHVESVIMTASTSSALRDAKKKALENETQLLKSIMDDVNELGTFLKNIILIENLFNKLFSPFKKKQEDARARAQTHVSSFQMWIDKIIKQCAIQEIKIVQNSNAKTKKIERSFYKAFYVYGATSNEGFKEMTDMLRCSLVFDDFDDLYRCYSVIELMAEQSVGGILRVKDRYHPMSMPFGYRDMLINVMCPGSTIVCEVQLHFNQFYKYKKISHKMYKKARLFERDTKNLAYEYSSKFIRPNIGTFKVYEVQPDEMDDDAPQELKGFALAQKLLDDWGLSKYAKTFEDEGWDDPDDWDDLVTDGGSTLKEELQVKGGHVKRFIKKYNAWRAETSDVPNQEQPKVQREPEGVVNTDDMKQQAVKPSPNQTSTYDTIDQASNRNRFGGTYLIQWDKNRFYEGQFRTSDNINFTFRAHDGDTRTVQQQSIYQLGVLANVGDTCVSYWTDKHKYLNPGRVTDSADNGKLFVTFDDGDKDWMPRGWVHKKVNITNRNRFGGNALIKWDSNRFFEGSYDTKDSINFAFRAHDGDRRTVKQADVYLLGLTANVGDLCVSYWTDKHKYLNPGKVQESKENGRLLYVVFDDGDKGWMACDWVHKKVNLSNRNRFGGDALIKWDQNRYFEGSYNVNDKGKLNFLAHDGDRRTVDKSDVYQLGIEANVGDFCVCYWTDKHKYLNPGKVTNSKADLKSLYVEFDDGDVGWMASEWVHKKLNVL
eukprot:437270_1